MVDWGCLFDVPRGRILDGFENVVTYRANGGSVLHTFPLNRMSRPEVRDRTDSVKLRKVTSHFLYFDHLEATTFVFDGHSAEDLEKVAATVNDFVKANKSRMRAATPNG